MKLVLSLLLAAAAAQPSGSARGPRKDLNGTWPRKDLNGTWPRKDWNGTVNASCFSIFEELKERRPAPGGPKGKPDGGGKPDGKAEGKPARGDKPEKPEGGGKGKGKPAERDAPAAAPTFEAAFPATNGTFPKDDVERCFAEFGEKKREKEAEVLGEEKALEYELYGVDGDACLAYFAELKDGAEADGGDPDLAACFELFDDAEEGGRPDRAPPADERFEPREEPPSAGRPDRAPPADELFEPREDASDEPEEAAAASADDDEEQDPAIVKKAHAHAAKVSSAKASVLAAAALAVLAAAALLRRLCCRRRRGAAPRDSDATPRAKPTLINVVQAQRISPDCKEKLADGGRVYPAACKEKECDLEAPPIATCSASPL